MKNIILFSPYKKGEVNEKMLRYLSENYFRYLTLKKKNLMAMVISQNSYIAEMIGENVCIRRLIKRSELRENDLFRYYVLLG